jgi:Ca-activated chloride channel family protein
MPRRLVFVLAAVSTLATTWLSHAAPLARVQGRVLDNAGSALPGATLELRGAAGALATTSDQRGAYAFANVTPGTWTLSTSLIGFASTARALTLRAGQVARVDLTLSVASLAEVISVAAAPVATSRRPAGWGALPRPSRAERRARANTEEYRHLADNPFVRTQDQPRSTFAADVDTAAYTNVRRFLVSDGELPPADAVRIEELLNYFAWDDPIPQDGAPVRATAEVGECPWAPGHRLLRVGLKARALPAAERPPLNLVFLIDVSGSMDAPDKLPLLVAGLRLLAQQLDARDRVAIVVYAGAAGVVLPSTPGDRRAAVLRALSALQAGGSTNGAEGIELAYQVARSSFLAEGQNRVVLCTDGDFNVGPSSEGELVRLIERERESGVFLSVLGFGEGNLADARMEALADKGNGNYAYIDSLAEARRALVRQAGGTLVTVAKDVKLQVEFNPRLVQAWRLIGYENRLLADADFRDDRKDAGEVGAGHALTALFELVPAGGEDPVAPLEALRYQRPRPRASASASDEWAAVALRYKEPHGRRSRALSTVVALEARDSSELRFAAAVAGFGMLLRDSPHKGHADWRLVEELARSALGDDPEGERAGFVDLVHRAAELAQPEPQP